MSGDSRYVLCLSYRILFFLLTVYSASWSYITSIITTNVAHLASIQFGAHNDMDMMEIGNGDLTIEEQRTHFAMWVALKSPILLVRTISGHLLFYLTN